MKKNRIYLAKTLSFTAILVLFLSISSCEKEVNVENQEELITTVTYTLRPMSIALPTVVCTYKDLDGDGGNSPTFTISGPLLPNTTYDGTIVLFNESVSPKEDITVEVDAESTAHQFFFETGASITVTYNDTDGNGKPVGIKTVVKTGAMALGQSLKITLRHEPDKSAAGVKDGNITNAGGETDVQVNFTIDVK